MNIAVIGSRGFRDYAFLSENLSQFSISKIISGGAYGADSLARRFALARRIPLVEFRPDYELHGKVAPLIRNRSIISNADAVVAFWDGKSSGTAHALRIASKMGIACHIFKV